MNASLHVKCYLNLIIIIILQSYRKLQLVCLGWRLHSLSPLELWVISSQVSCSKFEMSFALYCLDQYLWGQNGHYVNAIYHAVMVHCRERGDEMIVGDLSHLHIYEQGGSAQVSLTELQTLHCNRVCSQKNKLCCIFWQNSMCLLCWHSWLESTPPQWPLFPMGHLT